MCRLPPLVYFWIFFGACPISPLSTPPLLFLFLLKMRAFWNHHNPSYAIHSHPCWYIPVRWNRRTRNRPGAVGLDWKLYLLHEPFWTILVQRLHFRPWPSKVQRHFLRLGWWLLWVGYGWIWLKHSMFEGLGWWAWWLLMMVCDIVWWYYMIVSSSMFIVAHEHLAWRHAVPKGIWEDRGSASREKGLELLTALPVCFFLNLGGLGKPF